VPIVLANRDQLNRTAAEDAVFDLADDIPNAEDDNEQPPDGGTESASFLGKVVEDVDAAGAANDNFCLASTSLFRRLFESAIGGKCPQCSADISVTEKMIGSCLFLKWQCSMVDRHHGSFSSQNQFTRIYTGNIKLTAATLLSGNSPRKIRMLLKFAGCGTGSETSFYKYVKPYIEFRPYHPNMWKKCFMFQLFIIFFISGSHDMCSIRR
jgi:hypothetical protein